MGFKIVDLKLPTDYAGEELERKISKKLKIKDFSYTIEKKSLDARKKDNIHWNIRVGVNSQALRGPQPQPPEKLSIPYKKRNQKIIVTGSGPAGFFAAYTLLQAGFQVTILEQGPEVETRLKDIVHFERTGELNESGNYAFGEGGAGTFSDGKLTSRTKTISKEKAFIFDTYITAGAPPEIAYLSHPHLGSDNLRNIVKFLRNDFIRKGGTFLFNTKVEDIEIKNQKAHSIDTSTGKIEADYFIFAIGHSSYPTYRMLMRRGVPFRVKPFALGCRVEHPQELINSAQWGQTCLPGIKAAEYRLTCKSENHLPVYSFCMCPGGKVVPATPYKNTNIVNGMSNYRRNSPYANAAIVAAIDLNGLLNKEVSPLEALDWLENLEKSFFDFSNNYTAPACRIQDFLENKISPDFPGTSYPFGLTAADFRQLLPQPVVTALQMGLEHFKQKLKGFETGIMLGLESKTSSPLQALRDPTGRSQAVQNLYLCGEGSGYAGGIISSAADGIKTALSIASGGQNPFW